eukprot:365070-Chlamydomonas_euryale.AAC.3
MQLAVVGAAAGLQLAHAASLHSWQRQLACSWRTHHWAARPHNYGTGRHATAGKRSPLLSKRP